MKSDDSDILKDRITNKILNFLSLKPRTVKEVERKLDEYLKKEKKFPEEEKERVKIEIVQKLIELKLLNDENYARDYVSERIKYYSTISPIKAKQFLIKKGVPKEIIEDSLKLYTQDIELRNATLQAEKKLKTLRENDRMIIKKKLTEFLIRKGFSFDTVRAVVDTLTGVK